MVSEQSTSASTLMETQVQGALAHTSSNVTLGADATVQGSVASVPHSLSGEPLTGVALAQPCDRPREIFTSMSLPIDARVTPKLKAKIWAVEFINFGQLITVTPNDEKFNISINTSTESPGQPTLCLEPLQKAKNISTIAAWTSAFQVFVGIYTSKFPAEAPALMKYGEVVRDLADKGANWIYYDTNFRYLRQQKSADFPWGTIYFKLWIRSQQFPRKNTNVPLNTACSSRGSTYVPIGYCRKYHRGGNCVGCSFKHECHKCHQNHPSSKFNFRAPGSKPPSQTKPRITNSIQNK